MGEVLASEGDEDSPRAAMEVVCFRGRNQKTPLSSRSMGRYYLSTTRDARERWTRKGPIPKVWIRSLLEWLFLRVCEGMAARVTRESWW